MIEVEISPSKKNCFICFDKSPLKIMENSPANISQNKGNQIIKFGLLIV